MVITRLAGEMGVMMPSKDTKIDEAVEEVKRRISEGIYTAGQRLPSERELGQELEVSRITVRAALQRLEAESVISIIPRAGAFVRAPILKAIITFPPPMAKRDQAERSSGFLKEMYDKGRRTTVRLIEPSSIIPLSGVDALRLDAPTGLNALRYYRVHLVEGVPHRILDSYYPESLLGHLEGRNIDHLSLFQQLRLKTGLRATHALEILECRMPTSEEASLLNISRSQPVITIDRTVVAGRETFEYTHIVANAALHEIQHISTFDPEASN